MTKVKCPDEIPSGNGKTFTCTVTWSTGASGKVKATQTGANRYTYAPVAGSVKIPGSQLEKQITEDLAKQGAPDATANCPDTVAVKVGTTVTCDVAGAGGSATGTVKFTFSSADGTVDSSSVETADRGGPAACRPSLKRCARIIAARPRRGEPQGDPYQEHLNERHHGIRQRSRPRARPGRHRRDRVRQGRADDRRRLPLLMDLVEKRIIRVLDVLFVTKGEDGTIAGFDASDLDERRRRATSRSSRAPPPGCWATTTPTGGRRPRARRVGGGPHVREPLGGSVHRGRAPQRREPIAFLRIGVADLMEALDAAEAAA